MYKVDNTIHGCTDAANKFEQMVIHEAERVKPIIREQFLREYILGQGDTDEIFNIYCRTFNVDSLTETRMIILKPFEEQKDLFFLKNIAEQVIGNDSLLLCTVFRDHILLITDILGSRKLVELLEKIRKMVCKCYDYEVMAIYSDVLRISDAPSGYERLNECLGYLFYADGSKVLYENEIKSNKSAPGIKPQYGSIERTVKNGDTEKMKVLLDAFFSGLEASTPSPAVAKTYCMELYVCIIRCCAVEKIDKYMRGIVTIQDSKTLAAIKSFINEKAEEIATANAPRNSKIYSSLIKDTIRVIDENIENENLSLRWIAGNILYTNVDYLGKLFKKETGKNFSHYVMEKRMEMAKRLIVEGKKDRIYEVAEKVGYGSNSQYFSQVFKKYTGVSPLEYKEFARITHTGT
ncbi:MAG: AraC family transcriptional regulator [Oscillospiraceae bacterium]|nr:AraC family transcriptional regulator [Oscillospiraceae bacterium]